MGSWLNEVDVLERLCNESPSCNECKLGYCIKGKDSKEESGEQGDN